MYQKDHEIIELKRQAGLNYRDCANAIGIHPNGVTQRCCGFSNWQPGERERLLKFLRDRIDNHTEKHPTEMHLK